KFRLPAIKELWGTGVYQPAAVHDRGLLRLVPSELRPYVFGDVRQEEEDFLDPADKVLNRVEADELEEEWGMEEDGATASMLGAERDLHPRSTRTGGEPCSQELKAGTRNRVRKDVIRWATEDNTQGVFEILK
ncbi:unnamed protein product, partial [Amoebophrya sp. A25]